MLSVSPFVGSIFFSESTLKCFSDFLHEVRGQHGTKNDLKEFFKKISNFLKSRKSGKKEVFRNFIKNGSKYFSHFPPEC